MIVKKLLLSLVLLPLLFACGDIPITQEAAATTILGNPDPMSVPCSTSSFVRRSQRICFANVNVPWGTLTLNGTCQTLNLSSIGLPTKATLAIIDLDNVIASNNAIAARFITIVFFTSNTCATAVFPAIDFRHREFAAVLAGTIIAQQRQQMTVYTSGSTLYYIGTREATAHANSVVSLYLNGYYD